MALFSNLLVYDGHQRGGIVYLAPGPLFPFFTTFFLITSLGGFYNIYKARQRSLTSTARRRMTYLTVSFAAPGLGVFPYLLISSMYQGMSQLLTPHLVLFLSLLGNLGVALMLIIMAYTVAYYGVLTPDRVIKHRLIHYLLRGPFVGICVIGVILLLSQTEHILGLPRDTAMVFAVVGLIVVLQVLINKAKPFIDRLIYSQDREEVSWIQQLDERLLTTTDLKQFLENVLIAMCELLRVRWGFVALMTNDSLHLEARCGPLGLLKSHLSALNASSLQALFSSPQAAMELGDGLFVFEKDLWLIPLRSENGNLLGVLGLEAPPMDKELTREETEALRSLVHRATMALEDRYLQQRVFGALKQIIPEIERIQRWRVMPYYLTPFGAEKAEKLDLSGPEYQKWVKDALSHYWGGPKLTKSPLLKLRVVSKALEEYGGNPTKALRAVLKQAIEALKPESQHPEASPEWLLYNILDMRFIQGRRPKEIADRLAISESDLYRKQKVAIEQVAKILAEMERREENADVSGR